MKKYLICLGGSHVRKSFEFPCIECAIMYVIDNPFEFVTFNILDSKQCFIYEMRGVKICLCRNVQAKFLTLRHKCGIMNVMNKNRKDGNRTVCYDMIVI